MRAKEKVKEKTLAPPKPTPEPTPAPEPDDRRNTPRLAGLILVYAGILLMLLSGWTPPVAAWESASSEGSAIVSGGVGDDDLFGKPGGEVIVAGEGDDFVEAKDGTKDHISCGPGDDVASVDGGVGGVLDVVASDCETVYGS